MENLLDTEKKSIIQLPNTSYAHKAKKILEKESSNVRRFVSFSQRLKTMNINATQSLTNHSQYILSLQKEENDMTTYTYDVLKHWKANNKTRDFQIFARELTPLIRTVQEMLFNKKEIISLITDQINKLKSDTAEAVLDVVWTMARELRGEFAKDYLPKIFVPMISKIDLKESTLMEILFRTLMLLFKFLYPYMIGNLNSYFQPYEKLLGNKNAFVRKFSAESFAFLLQKMTKEHHLSIKQSIQQKKIQKYSNIENSEDKMQDISNDTNEIALQIIQQRKNDLNKIYTESNEEAIEEKKDVLMSFLDILFQRLQTKKSDALYDGVSLLFFHSIKGVLGNFRSGVFYFLSSLLLKYENSFECDGNGNSSLSTQSLFLLLKGLFNQLISYAKSKEVALPVWKALYSHFERCSSLNLESQRFQLAIKHISVFINTLLSNPSKIDEAHLSFMMKKLFSQEWIYSFDSEILFQLAKSLEQLNLRYGVDALLSENEHLKLVPWKNIENINDPLPLFTFIKNVTKLSQERSFYKSSDQILVIVENYLLKNLNDSSKREHLSNIHIVNTTLYFLYDYILSHYVVISSNIFKIIQSLSEDSFNQLYNNNLSISNLNRLLVCQCLLNSNITIEDSLSLKTFSLSHFHKFKYFLFNNIDQFKQRKFNLSIVYKTKDTSELQYIKSKLQNIVAELIQSLDKCSIFDCAQDVAQIFMTYGDHGKLIQKINSYFANCWISKNEEKHVFMQSIGFSVETLSSSNIISLNLSSYDENIRKNMISMLINTGSTDESEIKVLKSMLRCEEQGQGFHTMRDKISQFKKVIQAVGTGKLSDRIIRFITIWGLGIMWIKLNLSENYTELFNTLADVQGDIMWEIMYPHVIHCTHEFEKERKETHNETLVEEKDSKHFEIRKKINFNILYKEIFQMDNIFDLEESKESTDHITVSQYFNYLWKIFITKYSLFNDHSKEVVALFDIFYSYSFNTLNITKIKFIGEKSFIGIFLLDFLKAFVYLNPNDLREHASFISDLVCTTHSQIQLAVIQVLKALKTPWITPYSEEIQGIVGSRSLSKALDKFTLKNVHETDKISLMKFLTKAFIPQLRTQKLLEKKNKRVHETIIKFLGKTRDDETMLNVLYELLSPILEWKESTLKVISIERSIIYSQELKRAIAICRFIVQYSFPNSGFKPLMDIIMKVVSIPLVIHMKKYEEKLSGANIEDLKELDNETEIHKSDENSHEIDENKMQDIAEDIMNIDKIEKADIESELPNKSYISSTKSTNNEDLENDTNVDISALAEESFKLSMLILKKNQDCHFSKKTLQLHMDHLLFYFNHWIPVRPSSIPFEAKIALEFLSYPALIGVIYYNNFMESLLNAIQKSETQAAETLLDTLNKLLQNLDEKIGKRVYQYFNESSLSENETISSAIVQPYINQIMVSLYILGQKSNDSIISKATNIAKILSPLFTDDTSADSVLFFFGIAIPKDATMEDKDVVEVLEIVKKYVPRASPSVQVKFITYLSEILLHATNSSLRLAICEIFEKISTTIPSISVVARLLRSFEARDTRKIGVEDFEQQIAAIREIKNSDFNSFEDIQWIPIVSSLLFKLRGKNLDVSYVCIEAFESIVSRIPDSESVDIIEREVRKCVTSDQVASTCLHILLLQILVQYSSKFAVLKNRLVHFYENMASSVYSKKIEAIKEFEISLASWYKKNLDATVIVNQFFFPMLLHLLPIKSNKMLELQKASKEALQTLFYMASKKSYQNMYEVLVSKLTSSEKNENQCIMDLLVQVSKRFTGAGTADPSNEDITMTDVSTSKSKASKHNKKLSMASFFMDNIVGKLRKSIFEKKNMMKLARIELASLLIEIISKFADQEKKDININYIFRDLISKLNSKEELQRERSRQVIVAIVKQLNSDKYLKLAVSNASHVLVNGFQRDVFLVTTQELFSMSLRENISLDPCVELILPILFRDIKKDPEHLSTLNKVDKKEDYNFGSIFVIVRQIGQGMNAETSLEKVIIHLQNLISNVTQRVILQRFETIFDQLAIGLSQNTSIQEEFLLSFSLLKFDETSLFNKEFSKSNSLFKNRKSSLRLPKYSHLEVLPEPTNVGYIAADSNESALIKGAGNDIYMVRMIVDLLLRYMKTHLKENSISKGYNHLFNYLLRFAGGDDEKLSLLSLQCLVTLRKHNSSYASKNESSIIDIIIKLLQSCGIDTSSETWDLLFSTLHFFINKVKFQFDNHFQQNIISILQLEISSQREESMHAYLLVKGMIETKVMLPQMYDLAKQCRFNLITSQRIEVQDICVQILKNFLIYYPMEPDLLQEYMNFIFKNVMNPNLSADSRRGLSEMIHTIVLRFPVEYLQQKIEFLICPLAVQICNEQSPDVKLKLEESTLFLLDRIDASTFQKTLKLVSKWIQSDKLSIVGFKILQISSQIKKGSTLAPYLKNSKFNFWETISKKLSQIPQDIIKVQSMKDSLSSELVCLLNIVECYTKIRLLKENDLEPIWSIFKILSLHRWVLVRDASLKCLQSFLNVYRNHFILKDEGEISSLGILALENLLSKNLDIDQFNYLKDFLEMIFAIIMEYHKDVLQKLDARDPVPAEFNFNQMIQDSTIEIFMKKIRTFYIQSQKTDDPDIVKKMRIQCILEVIKRIGDAFATPFATCLGYFTPTLYLIFEEGRSNDQEVISLTENCINSLKLSMGEAFATSYSVGRKYILDIREARKESISTTFLTDQQEFAKQKIAKRKANNQLKRDKKKRARLEM